MLNPKTLTYDADGLIPGVVQAPTGEIRMVGWLSREAVARTLDTGFVTFWSRSRQELWTKGATSGNRLRLLEAHADCDGDTLLLIAETEGPTCHRGTPSCFGDGAFAGLAFLGALEQLLQGRRAGASPEGSYTQKLFAQGIDRIAKKVVEEAGEVVLAAKNLAPGDAGPARQDFLGEAADLLFHLEMLLLDRGCTLAEVAEVLRGRHAARTAGEA